MTSSLADAYRLLAAESQIWAILPAQLETMAITLARGDKLALLHGGEGPARQRGATAIIPIMGPLRRRPSLLMQLLGLSDKSTYQSIGRHLADALADRQVEKIMLLIDSPGGTVGGLPELADDIARAGRTKPVTAIADGLAASAAFWLGSQATRFVAAPSAELGSIGVFLLHVDASRAVDAEGLTPTFIASNISPFKTEGNPLEPLAAEAKVFLQSQVDEIGNNFVRAVARGRGVSESTVTSRFGGGRVLLAPDAQRAGMVDRIETLARALSLAPAAKQNGVANRATPPRSASHNARHRLLEDHRHGDPRKSPRGNLIEVLGRLDGDKEIDRRDAEYWQRRIEEEKRS